jgi:hypothetical protein
MAFELIALGAFRAEKVINVGIGFLGREVATAAGAAIEIIRLPRAR